jgi:CRP-like cAMP-binding protein
MSGNNKTKRIHNLPFFKSASKGALEHLASAADEVSIEAGHRLISQGQHHNEGFVIESGVAEVEVDGVVVAEIPEGEMIGELAFFDRGPATATVKAKTAMTVLVIPYNRFDQIMDDNPEMVKAIARELAGRLRTMDAKHS